MKERVVYQSALVIGGTSGLGKQISEHLQQAGDFSVVAGRRVKTHLDNRPYTCNLDIAEAESRMQAIHDLDQSGWLQRLDLIVMVAGVGAKGGFFQQSEDTINQVLQTNLLGPLAFIYTLIGNRYATNNPLPVHLAVISSTTSWKIREDETAYAASKAGLSQATRGWGRDLPRYIPGSKVSLFQPGGMKGTNFYDQLPGVDTNAFMDTNAVGRIIVTSLIAQEDEWLEMQIERDPEGNPAVKYGSVNPQ